MKFCPKCKKEYKEDIKFCPTDGEGLLEKTSGMSGGKIYADGDVTQTYITHNYNIDSNAMAKAQENEAKVEKLEDQLETLLEEQQKPALEREANVKNQPSPNLSKKPEVQKAITSPTRNQKYQQTSQARPPSQNTKKSDSGCGCWLIAIAIIIVWVVLSKIWSCTEDMFDDSSSDSSLDKKIETEPNDRKSGNIKNIASVTEGVDHLLNSRNSSQKEIERKREIAEEQYRQNQKLKREARMRQELEREELERKKAQELAQLEELKKIAELKEEYLLDLKYVYLNFVREYWIERGAISGYKKQSMLVRGRLGSSIKMGSPDIGVWFWRQDWMEQLLLNCYESQGLRSDLDLLQGELLKQFLETFKKLFPSKRVFNVTRVQDLYSLLSANDRSLFNITLRQLNPTLDSNLSILFHNIDKNPPQRPRTIINSFSEDKSSSSYQPSPSDFMKALLPSSSLQRAFEEEFGKINWSRESGYQFNPFTH